MRTLRRHLTGTYVDHIPQYSSPLARTVWHIDDPPSPRALSPPNILPYCGRDASPNAGARARPRLKIKIPGKKRSDLQREDARLDPALCGDDGKGGGEDECTSEVGAVQTIEGCSNGAHHDIASEAGEEQRSAQDDNKEIDFGSGDTLGEPCPNLGLTVSETKTLLSNDPNEQPTEPCPLDDPPASPEATSSHLATQHCDVEDVQMFGKAGDDSGGMQDPHRLPPPAEEEWATTAEEVNSSTSETTCTGRAPSEARHRILLPAYSARRQSQPRVSTTKEQSDGHGSRCDSTFDIEADDRAADESRLADLVEVAASVKGNAEVLKDLAAAAMEHSE